MNKKDAKKFYKDISSIKKKYVTLDYLSKKVGRYPEVLAGDLAFFDPMITLDTEYNVKDLLPFIESYINEQEEKERLSKEKKEKPVVIKKSQLSGYKSVSDFVYKKMTIGGIVDKNYSFSEVDLKILKRLVNEELQAFKNVKKK